jgi:HopA1 effector protein family
MEKQLSAQLKKIIGATEIVSPAEISFAGRSFQCPPAPPVDPQNPQAQPNMVVAQLQATYYERCYVQPFNDGGGSMETAQVTHNEGLVQLLSAANNTQDHWETGWQITEMLPTGQIKAAKNGRSKWVWAGEFVSADITGLAPRVGTNVNIFFPKESTVMQPGFFFAYSQTFIDFTDDTNIIRFYWHIEEKGAPDLVGAISKNLNRFLVPYRFKVLNNLHDFNRSDAAVLFLNKKYYRIVMELMPEIYRAVKGHLKPEIPLFSKRIAPGIGFAEDPGNGDSFGMSRCRMLAEGLWSAYTQGKQTVDEKYAEVVGQFERYGISMDRPYLNSGSADIYFSDIK